MKFISRIIILLSLLLPIFKVDAFLCFDQLAYAYRIYRPGVDVVKVERAVQIAIPTQYLLGSPRIAVFSEELLNANLKELKRIIEKKPVPYVLGPNGQRHIIDRHHTLYTFHSVLPQLIANGIPVNKLKFEFRQVADLSHLSENKFLKTMHDRGWLYPFNKQGVKDLYNIPSHVSLLEFDFYRGLAWIVRKSGAIEKNDQSVPFLEFYWAKAFRDEFSFKHELFTVEKIRKAIMLALSRSKTVSNLPGYHQTLPPNMTVDNCLLEIQPILDILIQKSLLRN